MARGSSVMVLCALWLGAGSAQAHAILMESAPAIGAKVSAGPLSVVLRYNSRIDSYRSRISLTLPDGSRVVLPIAPSSADDSLETITRVVPGAYVLHWQVLAIDGHITRGDVPFSVGGP